MTIYDVLKLDCRDEENKKILQRQLKKIKPFQKYGEHEDVEFSKVEKLVVLLCKKYNMRVRDISTDVVSNKECIIWRETVIDDTNLKTVSVYGLSLYEVLSKSVIYMYSVRESVGARE